MRAAENNVAISSFFRNRAVALVMAVFLNACTTSIVVEGPVPTPLVNKIPIRVGVYYSDEFRKFKHQEVIQGSGGWSIDLGTQNLSFFQNLTKTLFTEVEEINGPELTMDQEQRLDAVFIPSIVEYGFLTPFISGLKFHSASIRYRVTMRDKRGSEIGTWKILGYGKSEGGMFSKDEAINEATLLAIRDGGARIAIEIINQPDLQTWLKSQRSLSEGSVTSAKPGTGETR